MGRSGQSFDVIMGGKYEDHTTILMKGVGVLIAGLPLAWIAATVLWHRPMEWMQLSFRAGWLVVGLGLGLLLPVVLVLILRILGQASIERSHSILTPKRKAAWMLGIACLAMFTGVAEEIVFRAMAARELSLVWGWPVAVLVAGAYFGVVHLVGQLKTLTLAKALTILASSILVSFLFIAMYVRSGSLWLPIGFHAAWNFSLVGILGLPMNGEAAEVSLLQTTLQGADPG
jgi:CAAX protease family protein